ncbi:YihY/virulence factor BrkB family protein [Halomonas cupida]|uniref:YihY family inner membrane protein n=1 Tax=Halomonas cupida TaxID=44933 RepID=A0A1M7AKL4_9GAMM|nr:YihY/virulence factor BrkB family protein [Halomonas cupida]GEN22348.1 hypothetical protein HCU01_02970 [Halomonas cupida]SHL43197.1 YihY family inner membrane protein [Halomonas cupida]
MSPAHRYYLSLLTLAPRLAMFFWRVLVNFAHNRGMLLAGGVGFNILLSTVPLFALMVVAIAQVVDEQQLMMVLELQARHIAPAHADIMLDSVSRLIDSSALISLYGIPVLLVFSSFAFRMLEDALAIIFHKPDVKHRRSLWVSFLLPYGFMLVWTALLFSLAIAVSLANTANALWMAMYGQSLPVASLQDPILNLISFTGVFLLFSSIYKILPVVRISLRRALAGGFAAASMWEAARLVLVYYFANLSLVNEVYGSLATLVVILLSLEIGAAILLLGAQVIADLEHNSRLGLPWHVPPGTPSARTAPLLSVSSCAPDGEDDESPPSDHAR